ncbi:hypothetical protein Vretimale_13017 [Volvox reticuliferus]|uniref:Reverse transcriptase domain-containing protein n=1 Tax=Volvox reticuliferus TaxID=1737510 RepID=A0A8J4GL47_9CHLO|nr:hypothetical protein Vretimale_13017 [Volvox reticuliferus]
MDEPFSASEVGKAIQRLSNGKSGGLGKIPAECLKKATRLVDDKEVNVMVGPLRALFEHIRSMNDFPVQFEVAALSPLHKKGDVGVMGNYRGLAVGSVLAKLYAFLLENRLSSWGEGNGVRSHYRGGFHKNRGTVHNIFVLRHMLDRHCKGSRASPPLYICQIDFEKAFDRVPRHLLWMRLEERGVGAKALESIKAGYEKAVLMLKVNGIKGDPFESVQGVKQGCPLSPTLYGIFGEGFVDLVDALDKHIPAYMSVDTSPMVDGIRIPLLLYADDLTLFAQSRIRMERLLEVLSKWCEAFGMRVNVKKTEVLEVSPTPEIRR